MYRRTVTNRTANLWSRRTVVLLSTASLATAIWLGRAIAQESEPGHKQSFHQLMNQAMTEMDQDMRQASMTGNPDHDFAAMMVPHHQGAIDMAKVELLYGKDPVLRRMAQEIIVTQQQEIAVMRRQLDAGVCPRHPRDKLATEAMRPRTLRAALAGLARPSSKQPMQLRCPALLRHRTSRSAAKTASICPTSSPARCRWSSRQPTHCSASSVSANRRPPT